MKNLMYCSLFAFICIPFFAQAQTAKLVNQRGGTHNYTIEVDGLSRQFIVHFPSTYSQNANQNFPVVFMLHGGGGSGRKYFNISGWKELGEQEGIITVFPTAYEVCLIDGQTQRSERGNYWLTVGKSISLCDGQQGHSDANFLRAIADYLKANHRTDARRFYCTGFSNGLGFTMSRVLPELSDVFAAAGGSGSLMQEDLNSPNPRPMLVMIGSHDPKLIRHNGNVPFPYTVDEVEQNEFLTLMMGKLCNLLNLGTEFTATEKRKHTLFVFENALDGGNQQLQFAILKDQKHIYPRGIPEHNGIQGAKIFWDFFKNYQL